MNLISESYREQNRQLHENIYYGVSGSRSVKTVSQLATLYETMDILDYGCGKRSLEEALGFSIKNYDPCIAGLDSDPEPAEFVVCGDVLEHVEPDYLDNVLDDIQRVTKTVAYLIIATKPAGKTLPDGRNAHLIQEDENWWIPKILSRFKLVSFVKRKENLHFICEKL